MHRILGRYRRPCSNLVMSSIPGTMNAATALMSASLIDIHLHADGVHRMQLKTPVLTLHNHALDHLIAIQERHMPRNLLVHTAITYCMLIEMSANLTHGQHLWTAAQYAPGEQGELLAWDRATGSNTVRLPKQHCVRHTAWTMLLQAGRQQRITSTVICLLKRDRTADWLA